MAKTPSLSFEIQFSFPTKSYKSFLNKLKLLTLYCATVGIHQEQGNKKVYHRFTYGNINKKTGQPVMHITGKSHRMTVAKLAYQNEFGSTITIRPRYKQVTRKTKTVYHAYRHRITETTVQRYSALRSAREQGYLLKSKTGKFVAYFKPNSKIHIPKRSFIRKIIYEPDSKLETAVSNVLQKVFVGGLYTPKQAITKVAKLVDYKMKNNVKNSSPKNHPLTVEAKGFNSPLTDEQDRLYRSIKFKTYRGIMFSGAGRRAFRKQTVSRIDKLLKSADQYNDKGLISSNTYTNVFSYKGENPNFKF